MKALFIIAPNNFRDEEFFVPYSILENAKVEIDVASLNAQIAYGTKGGVQPIALDLMDVDVSNYDAVIFIGGPGAKIYFSNSQARFIAQSANEMKKIIGAICIAPSILANSGILAKRKATSFPSEHENLTNNEVFVVKDQNVVVDENIVTASGPEYAKEFGEKILELMRS